MRTAIVTALLVATTAPLAAEDTVWWKTDGAAVVGIGDTNRCSMFIYQDELRGLAIAWGKRSQAIELIDNGTVFGQSVPTAIQIGNTWLSDPDKLDGQAIGSGHALTLPLPQAAEPLLQTADHVTIKLEYTQTKIDLPRAKMPALLTAVSKCRQLLR